MKLIYTSQYGTITEERARDLGLLEEDSPMQTLSTANAPTLQSEEQDPHRYAQGCTCVPDCACRVAEDTNVPCDCGCEACTEQNKDDFRGWDLGIKDFDRDELDEEREEAEEEDEPYCTCDPSCSRYDDTRRLCNCGCERCGNLVDEEIEGFQDAFINSPVSVVAEHWVYDVRRPSLIKHTLCEASMRIGTPCPVCGLYEGEVLKKASAQDLKKEILAIIKEELGKPSNKICKHDLELVYNNGRMDQKIWKCKNCGEKKEKYIDDNKPHNATSLDEEMTEWPRSRQADESAVDELLRYTENDGGIYERRVKPILKNLKRKAAKGIYDPKLAAKLWTYAADDAARKYEKEFGMPVGGLSVATRKLVGIELEKRNRDEVMGGQETGLEESTPKLEEQMGSGGSRMGRFGPLGLALDPEAESDIDDDLRSLDDPSEWELASMGLSKKDKKDPMRFSRLGDEGSDDNDVNEEYQPGEQISFKSIASKPAPKKEDPKAPKPGEEISMKSIVREDEEISSGMEETGKEYWKDSSYVAEKVAEATSLVTNDDPNAVHRMYGAVRSTVKDLQDPEMTRQEKEEFIKDLAEYFISMMTDESDDYQQVATEPDDEETGRSALEGSGMAREEAYTFRKMDSVMLGKAILAHFSH